MSPLCLSRFGFGPTKFDRKCGHRLLHVTTLFRCISPVIRHDTCDKDIIKIVLLTSIGRLGKFAPSHVQIQCSGQPVFPEYLGLVLSPAEVVISPGLPPKLASPDWSPYSKQVQDAKWIMCQDAQERSGPTQPVGTLKSSKAEQVRTGQTLSRTSRSNSLSSGEGRSGRSRRRSVSASKKKRRASAGPPAGRLQKYNTVQGIVVPKQPLGPSGTSLPSSGPPPPSGPPWAQTHTSESKSSPAGPPPPSTRNAPLRSSSMIVKPTGTPPSKPPTRASFDPYPPQPHVSIPAPSFTSARPSQSPSQRAALASKSTHVSSPRISARALLRRLISDNFSGGSANSVWRATTSAAGYSEGPTLWAATSATGEVFNGWSKHSASKNIAHASVRSSVRLVATSQLCEENPGSVSC
eukprot:144361_1